MNIWTVVSLVVGFILLVGGAEVLIKGASKLAATVGISPLVIGLTVVAFGNSSAPELAVSLNASLNGQADISLGNVVGSNICNVLLILGTSAVIAPLIVAQQLVRLDVPIAIGVSGLVMLFGLDGRISRFDGTLLFLGADLYGLLLYQSRLENDPAIQDEYAKFGGDSLSLKEAGLNTGLFALGAVMLVSGSQLLVRSAVMIAEFLGASPLIIGLTVIAFGTSLPELATSVLASFRGERDIAVGNVIGSNIFNILVVLGLTSAVSTTGVTISQSAIAFDIPIMLAVAVMCLPIFFTDNEVSRREGLLLLAYYLLYISYLVANATNPESMWVGWIGIVVVPLTALVLILLGWRTWQTVKRKRSTQHIK